MAEPTQQIIALGGGGFSMEPDNPSLDLYVLGQARSKNPAVCFLPTASGDADRYIAMFYSAFARHRCRPTHLTFFGRTPDLSDSLLCCPHYDGEPERRPALHRLVARRVVPTALALDDGAAAHFVGRRLSRIVSAGKSIV